MRASNGSYGSLSGRSGPNNFLASIDFYRKMPSDLLESSGSSSSILSLVTLVTMVVLFLCELSAYLRPEVVSGVVLDSPETIITGTGPKVVNHKVQLNFNITMMDMACEFVEVDVLDVLGEQRLDIQANVDKWGVNQEGIRRLYHGRNRKQADINHDHDDEGTSVHGTIEDLHSNGEHALPVDKEGLKKLNEEMDFVFVDFYAPWCIWCQRLEPTWEALAENIQEKQHLGEPGQEGGEPMFRDAAIAKVDCTTHSDFCGEQKIQAFPTLRVFYQGEKFGADYKGDRTVEMLRNHLFNAYAEKGIELSAPARAAQKEVIKGSLTTGKKVMKWVDEEHPGCEVSGHIWLNKVPGRLQIEAKSSYHEINPLNANVSHIINHISFGEVMHQRTMRKLAKVPEGYKQVTPLDGNVYGLQEKHRAHHHHVKVVPTSYELWETGFISWSLEAVQRMFRGRG